MNDPAVTLLFVAAALGLLPAVIAQRKGYSFGDWWIYGLVGFPLMLPWSLVMKPNPATRRPCAWCLTSIDRRARVCATCGRDTGAAPSP